MALETKVLSWGKGFMFVLYEVAPTSYELRYISENGESVLYRGHRRGVIHYHKVQRRKMQEGKTLHTHKSVWKKGHWSEMYHGS